MIPETLPLFPLQAVLLPGGRMPLQIFEPRYLDLISRCMREGSGFGVVQILRGREVIDNVHPASPDVALMGTEARIVDWDALPHNRLRITIEGARRFNLQATEMGPQRLLMGDVAWVDDSRAVEGTSEHFEAMQELLDSLIQHPVLRQLGVSREVTPGTLAWTLAQYLPIDDDDRYLLLTENDPHARLTLLEQLLTDLGGGPQPS